MSLETFDAEQTALEQELASPIDDLEKEQTRQQLRRIGRQLRTRYRHDFEIGVSPALRTDWAETVAETSQRPLRATERRLTSQAQRRTASWFISLLILVGVLSFCTGLSLLAWAAAFQLPRPWQWGMTTTIGAEGALILGLAWMAARLWQNSRRVNRQLGGVDRQLTEIQRLAGSLAGSRMSSSQHYFDHFSPSASPHMQVANLRGQVDQLASRLAS